MNPMHTLIEAGLTLNTEGTRLFVGPASALTDELRELIRRHKPELLAAVHEAEVLAADLIAAINRCCDVRGDSDRNRAGLIEESGDFTPDHQRDLIEHFAGEADRWHRANRAEQP